MAKNTVIVSILGDTRDLNKKLGGAGGAFGKFAKVAAAGAAVAAAATVAVGVKAVRSASNLEQAMGGMGSVFKSNTAQMEKWATGAASSVGLAKSEYANLATILGSQMKNMGVSAAELGGKTNDLIGLGSDLAAQFGGSTSDAVSALSSLLRGERDPIERYGVSITAASVSAKMAEMGLAGLSGEAEKNAKLSATLALLYDQTADAQGAFARESTTLAGAQQRVSAGMENLYATLGTSLLPAVTAVVAAFGSFINTVSSSEWFTNLTANLTEASNRFADFTFSILNGDGLDFGAFMDGLLPAITSGIQNAAQWLSGGGILTIVNALATGRDALLDGALTVFRAIAEALPQIVPAVIEAAVMFIQQLGTFIIESAPLILTAALELFTGLVSGLAQIIPPLLAAVLELLPQLIATILGMIPTLIEAAVLIFTTLIDALPIILPDLIAAIIGLLPVLVTTILNLIPTLLTAAVELFTSLISALPMILPNLLIELVRMAPKMVSSIISMIPTLLKSGTKLFTAIVNAIPTIAGKLGPALGRLGPKMVSAVKSMIPQLLAAGGDLVRGLADGLWRNAGSVVGNLLNIAQNAISAFKNFLGIHSPSRVFMQMGEHIDDGLADGLKRGLGTVRRAVGAMNAAVTDEFNADLTAGTVTVSGARSGRAAAAADGSGNVYQIHVEAINPGPETGRVIVEAIRRYEGMRGAPTKIGGGA